MAAQGSGRPRASTAVGGPVSGMVHRPALAQNVRTASQLSTGSTSSNEQATHVASEARPVASGNGVILAIALAEPVMYLQGFDQSELTDRTTTMLRGSLHLRISKPAKIKTIFLSFKGRAETDWPEGIPPKKTEFKDRDSIINHIWPFFNAQFQTAEYGTGADIVQPLKGPSTTTTEIGVTDVTLDDCRRPTLTSLTAKEQKRGLVQAGQPRNYGKDDSALKGPSIAQRGYRLFTPGDYIYNFELPIDSRLPETINVDLGNVKYELEAIVERAGAFRSNLAGTREVELIRAPAEGSLEQVEPIAISRNWEDQLHYEIVISGKSFPLGAQIPIAFKLTPLAKVQCHRIKVYVTENIQYFTSNRRVHRLEPTRKLQLFEKRADSRSASTFPGSQFRITAGGGVAYDARGEAARGNENVPRDSRNLLGDLDTDGEVGPTEMEFNVQLPSCHEMKQRDRTQRLHFDTTYGGIQVHHWIKIVMRLSRPDSSTEPGKRRHFEISIDSPFHILSCQATQANIALPAYGSPESTTLLTDHLQCGCPGAPRRRNSPSQLLPTLKTLRVEANQSSSNLPNSSTPSLARPQAAHVHNPEAGQARPIHLLRNPSFNPPPFSDDDPPPPLITPPPNYDTLVGDRNGLDDYFQRLANEVSEDEDNRGTMSPGARMELPLTPGGRVNRSMDERRTWLPIGQTVTQ